MLGVDSPCKIRNARQIHRGLNKYIYFYLISKIATHLTSRIKMEVYLNESLTIHANMSNASKAVSVRIRVTDENLFLQMNE